MFVIFSEGDRTSEMNGLQVILKQVVGMIATRIAQIRLFEQQRRINRYLDRKRSCQWVGRRSS